MAKYEPLCVFIEQLITFSPLPLPLPRAALSRLPDHLSDDVCQRDEEACLHGGHMPICWHLYGSQAPVWRFTVGPSVGPLCWLSSKPI